MNLSAKPPLLLEKIFVIIGFLIVADAFRVLFSFGQWQMIRMAFYAVTIVLCGLNFKRVFPTIFVAPFFLVITIFAISSILWSDFPGATISRSIGLFGTTVFMIYVVARFNVRQQINLLMIAIVIILISCYVFVFAMPGIGRAGGYAWLGIFAQKNVLGRTMAIATLLFLLYPTTSFRGYSLRSLGYLLALILVIQSNSMTAVLITITVTLMYYFYNALRLKPLPAIALMFITGIPVLMFAFVAITVDTDDILIALGRDPSLTGRADVWTNLDYAIDQRPWFGYGYGAFWSQWDGMYGDLWSRRDHWKPTSAHHAYRDVTLEVGKIGFGLFVAATVVAIAQALYLIKTTKSGIGLWPALYLTLTLMLGFSESFILYNTIFWALYVLVGYSLGKVTFMQDKQEWEQVALKAPESSQTPLVAVPTSG